jgi:hypothetical protein
MSAVEHQVDGKKQVFVPRLGPNYPVQNLVSFLSELKSSVDLRLHLCMSLFCLLRVLLFALGRVLT